MGVARTDEALAAFNNIMTMETFSLLDDEQQASLRDDLSLYEAHKTRLLRVDLGTRPFGTGDCRERLGATVKALAQSLVDSSGCHTRTQY
jgi:hypothetical protein